jgi:hypothetical protein
MFFAVRIGSAKYFADAANQKPWAASKSLSTRLKFALWLSNPKPMFVFF